jgi:hypothetical protein
MKIAAITQQQVLASPWNKIGANSDLVRIKSQPRIRPGRNVRANIALP